MTHYKTKNTTWTQIVEQFVDYKSIIANKSATLLAGNGCKITHPKQTNWVNNFIKNNKLTSWILSLCYKLSHSGTKIVGFDYFGKTAEKDVYIYVCDDGSRVLRRGNKIVGAYIRKYLYTKNYYKYYIVEYWNEKEVRRSYYYDDKRMSVSAVEVEVDKKYFLPHEEKNLLGFVPFVEFQNKPFNQEGDIEANNYLPNLINKIAKQFFMEIQKNSTRVFGSFANVKEKQEYINALKQGDFIDYFIDYKQSNLSGSGMNLELVQGNPKLLEFMETLERLESKLMISCGYSTRAQILNATATEIAIQASNDTKTTNIKNALFNEAFNDLLAMIQSVLKFSEPFEFSLNKNIANNKNEELEYINKQVEYGFLSRSEAIQQLHNLNEKEADAKLKNIDEYDKTQIDRRVEYEKALGAVNKDE